MISIKNIIEFLKQKHLEFEFIGDENIFIEGFSSLNKYKNGTITWCKTISVLESSSEKRYCVLVAAEYKENICDGFIITKDPKKVYFAIIEEFFSKEYELPEIGYHTYISKDVKVGHNVKIGHNCVLDGNISIGDNTIIFNNVSIINNVTIGESCVIQSGTVLGHDCYAYVEDEAHNKQMIKHYGGILIEDDVWIGCCCVINRGTIDDTVIGRGSKIDDYCHISHNVELGPNSALISGAKLYGSVKTGENSYIASAIVKNQIILGDNVTVGMGSVVMDKVEDNTTVVGIPARVLKTNKG